MLTRLIRTFLVQIASRASVAGGSVRIVFPNGEQLMLGNELPTFTLFIADEAKFLRKVILGGEIGLGEAYMDGLWTTNDLAGLLTLGARNRPSANHPLFRLLTGAFKWRDRRRHLQRKNTPERAKDNIHKHYDLSNELFGLFLDETLTYSCPVFEHPPQELADAQRNKYRLLCQKAGIAQGDHILEIGTGWGGLALFAAKQHGCKVTTVSISQEQVALTRERVQQAGVGSLVNYVRALREWREAFLTNLAAVRDLGFTDRFIRKWEYYLSLCEAGFKSRIVGDVQLVFEKPGG